jgi:hypothetical protein
MAITPIQGVSSVKAGSTTTFTDATPAGIWSSSNTAVATINATTGVCSAVAQGNCQIIYTIGSDSTAINFTVLPVSSLTNGFDFNKVYAALQNRVLWQSQGAISDSQQYYEDVHPLCDTNLLDKARPQTGTLTAYLASMQRAIITQMVTAVYSHPQAIDRAKLAFPRTNQPLPIQLVANQSQFVGLRFYVGRGDHAVKVNSLQLFFNQNVSFNLYLYNDFYVAPLMTIPVTAIAFQQTIIDLQETMIFNNLAPDAYKGGRFYLGYWQDDLGSTQAIYYPAGMATFHPVEVMSFSSPPVTDSLGQKNFNRNTIGANNQMYGLNVEVSTFVDATNAIVQNAHLFDELMGLIAAVKTVKALIFSYRSNSDTRKITGIPALDELYGQLNGFKAGEEIPYVLGLQDMVNRSIKSVKKSFQENKLLSIGTN